MKTRLLALAMLLCTFTIKAQYVTIPDPAFATYLQQSYPSCMNGNQMDTTCADITTSEALICSHAGILNLDGLQYFDSLKFLNCSYNSLSFLPALPPNLISVACSNNQISSLPVFPNHFDWLSCGFNQLSDLPNLPQSLTHLYCEHNSITQLPALPPHLVMLECSYNQLSNLPTLPDSLIEMTCSNNPILSLPNLPANLLQLDCSDIGLTDLPPIPSSLRVLLCSWNLLSTWPILPDSLTTIWADQNNFSTIPSLPSKLGTLLVGGNALSTLPTLPQSLRILHCSSNTIDSLPQLPDSLYSLLCTSNIITHLPSLPNSLVNLHCSSNFIDSFPNLPSGLQRLTCSNNLHTTLPDLPATLTHLTCGGNFLNHIPDLPDSLLVFNCENSPNLFCLPKLNYINEMYFDNTSIGCLPNYGHIVTSNPSVNIFPLCDPTNACPSYANISGRTYADRNNNCAFDSTDQGQYNIKHSLFSNGILLGQTYSNSAGNYSFDETGLGNYETRLDTTGLPFIVACPAGGVYYDTLTINDSLHFNRDFALQCKTGFDIAAHSVASAMVFRPANNTMVDVHAGDLANFYSASCAHGVSGTVTVTLHGPISYISPAANAVAPSNVTNNVLTWNVADFGTANALSDFNIIVQTDTFAQSGQQACFDVNVIPLTGDNDTSNNHLYHCFNIVNSYDPNDKTAYPSGNIDTTQEWLTYTVRFQNTGTAEAQHIYIMDTLDTNVKEETFQLLSYSHQPNVQIKENIVRFNFPFINLPYSTSDEPGSHGYVQYKVKLKEDLAIGTAINNTAYIYFDFNPPVVTNTATNTVAVEEDTVETGIIALSNSFDLSIYPNPANQSVTVTTSKNGKTLNIHNAWGELVLTQYMQGTAITINISNLPSGMYIVGTGTSNIRKRLVKL